jgi:hypothetical protein
LIVQRFNRLRRRSHFSSGDRKYQLRQPGLTPVLILENLSKKEVLPSAPRVNLFRIIRQCAILCQVDGAEL